MTCLHNHDQILEFLRKIFLKGFQIYQNYLCALSACFKFVMMVTYIHVTLELLPILRFIFIFAQDQFAWNLPSDLSPFTLTFDRFLSEVWGLDELLLLKGVSELF